MPIYDLTHRIENRMPEYPGDPVPQLYPVPDIEPPWRVSRIVLGSHTGTHMDAPCHCIPGGKSIDQYEVDRFMLPGLALEIPDLQDGQPIEADLLANALSDPPAGGAVVIRTGWSRYWGSERYWNHPFLTGKAAEALVAKGVSLVGIDVPSVDSSSGDGSLAHQILLGNDVLIVENLRLDQIQPGRRYQFAFLPLPLAELDGSPIRAIAW